MKSPRNSRHTKVWLLIFTIVFLLSFENRMFAQVGIVKTKPTKGRFVKTEKGYMVPYQSKLPGTDVKFEMVPVPGGEYLMGSPESENGRSIYEGPQIKVKVEPFWIGKYEVTWDEYMAYMDLDTVFKQFEVKKIRKVNRMNQIDAITAPSRLYDPELTFGNGDDPNQPAVTMTQYAARQYTKWLSLASGEFYRLPTGAEWEYACRAGTRTTYYFGNDPSKLSEYGWFKKNSGNMRQKVGQKKPNAWGIHDMHGNAAEWVIDTNAVDGYAIWEGRTILAHRDIRWPKNLNDQIVRGGSYEFDANQCRSAAFIMSDDEEWKDEDPCLPESPWWFTTEPATGVGMRIIRPLHTPDSRKEKERFWGPDVKESRDNAESKIDFNGRGSYGLVDKDLPKAMEKLEQED